MTQPLTSDWRVVALSVAGILFILLGLIAFALPAPQEGELLLRLDSNHSVNLMDAAGLFAVGLGIVLAWLGGMLWQKGLKT